MASTANLIDRRPIRRRSNQCNRTGHSTFNVVSLLEDEHTFAKNDTKIVSKLATAQTSNSATSVDNSNLNEAQASVKKELDGVEMEGGILPNSSSMEIQIKDEPVDEINTSNADEQTMQQIRQQIVPVIKTETGNSVSAIMQRPLTIQQSTQLQQQQPHQQTFSTNDQTLILSSRPIRRLTTNGPSDGKSGK